MKRIIDGWLATEPEPLRDLSKIKHLVIDGSYLKSRHESVVAVIDGANSKPIFGKYGIKESYPCLMGLFSDMRSLGCNPVSATIDGLPATFRALRCIWPEIIIQRCVVHIQRQGLMWCRAKPKRTDAKKLREMFLKITHIKTKEDEQEFKKILVERENHYGYKIENSKETGWVFSDLKRARSMLLKAFCNAFHYIGNENIPKTTNSAEGCFSRLKGLIKDHRGIKGKRREYLFKWFIAVRK